MKLGFLTATATHEDPLRGGTEDKGKTRSEIAHRALRPPLVA
jgi:hypothetical protein